MKTHPTKKKIQALTLVEVLVVLGMFLLLAVLILPTLAKAKARGGPSCAFNLKRVGLSFMVWAGDNNGKYPMQVSVTNGGTKELVESGFVFPHFEIMSNELNTPKILFCHSEYDPKKIQATAFRAYNPYIVSKKVVFTSDENISYFLGVDASQTNSQMFLAGDRNITNYLPVKLGLINLTTNQALGWTDKMHNQQGNVLLTDGSVQQLTTLSLRQALQVTGVATNRLALP